MEFIAWFGARLTEPSTYAGIGLVFPALVSIIITHGADGAAWAQLFAGVGAILKSESASR